MTASLIPSMLIYLFVCLQILIRLSKLCVQNKKSRNQQQRLLKNMGAHLVVLDLLQIPFEKVILIILVLKNMNSIKGKASSGPRINVNIFLTEFSQLRYKHEIMMPFSALRIMGLGLGLNMAACRGWVLLRI